MKCRGLSSHRLCGGGCSAGVPTASHLYAATFRDSSRCAWRILATRGGVGCWGDATRSGACSAEFDGERSRRPCRHSSLVSSVAVSAFDCENVRSRHDSRVVWHYSESSPASTTCTWPPRMVKICSIALLVRLIAFGLCVGFLVTICTRLAQHHLCEAVSS